MYTGSCRIYLAAKSFIKEKMRCLVVADAWQGDDAAATTVIINLLVMCHLNHNSPQILHRNVVWCMVWCIKLYVNELMTVCKQVL